MIDTLRLDATEVSLLTPDVDALPADLQRVVQRAWAGRAGACRARAASLAEVVSLCAKHGLDLQSTTTLSAQLLATLATAASCEGLGQGSGEVRLTTFATDEHVSPLEATLQSVLVVCCLRSTMMEAVSRAEAARASGDAQRLLHRIAGDCEAVSRAGWTLFTETRETLPHDARAGLSAFLVDALAVVVDDLVGDAQVWIGTEPRVIERGVPDHAATRTAAIAALEELVIPRLEAIGMPARHAWRRASR